jgi:hypothetical protein
MSRAYDGKTTPLQASVSDRLNFITGWVSHAVERTKFLPDANSFVDSTIQIVHPFESMAQTQLKLQPAFLRLQAIIFQYFTFFSSD